MPIYDSLIRCLLVGTVCTTLAVAQDFSQPTSDNLTAGGLDLPALQQLDVALQQQIDEQHVAGLIALISRNGQIGYLNSFGNRVNEPPLPMTEDTLFRIYSMTKPIVAVTAMTLWEDDKFKLDDPISDHLPEWKDMQVQDGDQLVPAETPVTVRHLLTHSAGLSYNRKDLALGPENTLQEFSESLAARPLEFQPGSDYRYGYSIDVLGRYLEAVSGQSLDQLMRERVFDPLEMHDTDFWVRDSADQDRVAHVYTKSGDGKLQPQMTAEGVMDKPVRMMGGQGLISTAGDYAKFCQMLVNDGQLNDTRILQPETVDLMRQNHLESIDKVYGLGGMVDGKGAYSWGGAAGTRFWTDKASDSYVVFMIQTWNYKAPTFDEFRKLAHAAIGSQDE